MRHWLCMGLAGVMTVTGGMAEPAAEQEAVASTNGVEDVKGLWRDKDVYVYARETWTLEITYLNLGTRSEGQQGRLLEDGKLVENGKKDRSLVTPLGLLKYYGSERKRPWDITGWNFADRRKIRRSVDLPREPEAPGTAPATEASR